jgi:hypothetical protein
MFQTKVSPIGTYSICKSREEAHSPAEHNKPELKNVDDLKLNEKASKEVSSSVRHLNKDEESIGMTFIEESSCGAHAFVMNADTMIGSYECFCRSLIFGGRHAVIIF